jgi:serine/threonine-protein kinase
MAWVYQVERLDVGGVSLWALKELRAHTEDPDTQAHARTLFEQEAAILSQLDHPNLPQVIDFFEQGGRAYLVMEFIWGESLEKRLEQTRSPLMQREVLQWSVQICGVLDYLHSRQPPVIFRDMKPSNVMVDSAGVIKLIDFGIARTYKEHKLQDTIALGSENYAAPEQWGEAQTDARSDIYGLGATMYHLLANMPPSPAFLPTLPTPLDAMNPALSETTVDIVSRAMARERAERYQNAQEMRDALLTALPGYVSPLADRTAQPRAHQVSPPHASQQVAPVRTAVAPALATPSSIPDAGGVATQIQPRKARDAARVCPSCRYRNAPGYRFCVQCGHALGGTRRPAAQVKICPRCKNGNAPTVRFCVRCGHPFVGVRPAVLRIVEPVRAAWEMPVAKSPMLFGRAWIDGGYRPDFDMSFYDPQGYISRRHGQIAKAPNGYFLTDLGSSNGTYVNGQSLPPHVPRLLRNGDKVEVGEVVFQFLLR